MKFEIPYKTLKGYLGHHNKFVLPTNLQIGLWTLVLFISILLSIKNIDVFQLGVYMDDASYTVLAKSICCSDQYGLINYPGEPRPTRYPFGYPLLLSFIIGISSNLSMLKLLSIGATLLNISLLFWGWTFFSENKSYWWALAVASLYAFSPLIIGHTSMVMSEPVYTTISLLVLILAERLVANIHSKWTAVFLGVALFFVIFIRTIGVVLFLTIFSVLIIRVKKQAIVPITIMILSGTLFLITVLAFSPVSFMDLIPVEYVDQGVQPDDWGQDVPVALHSRLVDGLDAHVKYIFREAVLPIGGGGREMSLGNRLGLNNLPAVIGASISLLIVLGFGSIFQKRGLLPFVILYELLYIAAMLIWPWRGNRFLYPIQPFLLYQFLIGFSLLTEAIEKSILALSPRFRRLKFSTPVLMFFITGMLLLSLYKGSTIPPSNQFTRNMESGTDWLALNTSPTDFIWTQQPEAIYLYSDRKTINYPQVTTENDFVNSIKQAQVAYIFVAPKLEWRQDGQLIYDEYTDQIFLPLIQELVANGELLKVYDSADEQKIQIYKVANDQ